jgi:hypothetical protein
VAGTNGRSAKRISIVDAMHAWCGVHLLRDLKGLYEFEPGEQD